MKSIIKYILFSIIITPFFNSCSDDYLEVNPKGQSLESNYYRNADEAYAALVAAYDPVGWISANYVAKEFALNIASDDHYAGGGNAQDANPLQVWSNYTLDAATGPQEELWRRGYSGVFRTNILLSKLPDVDMDENLKARYTAESKFLRAYYYFDLIRLFKRIPLFKKPLEASAINNVLQVDREQVYALIEEDLLAAINDLPLTIENRETEAGRATQGAAKALLGKMYLYQERFNEAVTQLQDVNGEPGGNNMYGYKLLDNFGDLFKKENQFNSESIFEVIHSSASNGVWDCIGCTEGNLLSVMSAPRGYTVLEEGRGAPNFVSGWGFNVVTENLVAAFIKEDGSFDGRYPFTITNVDSLAQEGIVNYDKSYQGSGYFLKKFAGTKDDRSDGGGNWELNFPKNFYDIRLADTYLMEAEALVRGGGNTGRAQKLLDAVRTRSGNNDMVSATFENILKERRLELAGEGHRWFDLVRTGMAAEALEFKGYIEGKHNKLPIPLQDLNNTLLEQDPAYQ
ncbi:RagB/SusD family nutrient uptake outer membrane protein [Zunongwangia sp.]|uniref:RagB/SusD family nutrient uptake outer membrane protein n=1 Tax=Zunongwangia sp. TaxID=1965325 RepID=UPI003AA98421